MLLGKIRKLTTGNKYAVALITIAAVYFLYLYWINLTRPGAVHKMGWYQVWHDQRVYYTMARKLSSLDFLPRDYGYPIGYPLLGALFYRFLPKDPFLVPDLILFTSSILFFYLALRNLLGKKVSFWGTLLLLFGTSLANMSVVPWTTTVALAMGSFAFYVITTPFSLTKALLLAGAAGYAFFTRYAGGVVLLPFLWMYLAKFWKERKDSEQFSFEEFGVNFVVTHFVFGLFVLLTFAFNYLIFGNLFGRYLSAVESEGLQSWTLWPTKLVGIFLNSFVLHGEKHHLSTSLLGGNFIFLLVPLGFVWFVRKEREKRWFFLAASSASFIIWFLFYIPFGGFSPSGLKYGNLHYFKVVFPILTFFSFYALVQLWEEKARVKTLIVYIALFLLFIGAIQQFRLQKLGKKSFTVEAFPSGEAASLAVDGDSKKTRWDTGRPQRAGDYFLLKFEQPEALGAIRIVTRETPQACPNAFQLESSLDEKNWETIFTYKRKGSCKVIERFFLPFFKKAQFVRIMLTESDENNWWAINEILVFVRPSP